MLKKYWLNLQLFGEGGDGGNSTGEGNEGGNSGEASADATLASIPEKARGAYKKALEKNKAKASSQSANDTDNTSGSQPGKVSYMDLIKSDDYKEEHQAYMDKTIQDRFKKYKGIEESNAKMAEALNIVASKYGLDSNADNFLDSLTQRIADDDSYYESYAMEHDISVDEAKKNIALERKVARLEKEEAQRKQEAQNAEVMAKLRASAEKTKLQFPTFDLDTEMQNPKFRSLVISTQGDTTAAYYALHGDSLIAGRVKEETERARQAMANSLIANSSRPIESGLSSQAASVVNTSFKGMSAKQMKEYALANMRR